VRFIEWCHLTLNGPDRIDFKVTILFNVNSPKRYKKELWLQWQIDRKSYIYLPLLEKFE